MNLNLKLSKLSNNELVAFGQYVNSSTIELTSIDTILLPFRVQLTKCEQAINDVLEKTKSKEISNKLKFEDGARDNYLTGLFKIFDAQEYHPNEEVVNAAVKLNQLVEKNGEDIRRQSYDKQSVSVKNLISDLKGDYAEEVALVDATEYVVAIEESQSRFDSFRREQLAENVEMAEIVSMSSLRKDFEQSVKSILQILPAMYTINPTDEYKQAIALMREAILKFK